MILTLFLGIAASFSNLSLYLLIRYFLLFTWSVLYRHFSKCYFQPFLYGFRSTQLSERGALLAFFFAAKWFMSQFLSPHVSMLVARASVVCQLHSVGNAKIWNHNFHKTHGLQGNQDTWLITLDFNTSFIFSFWLTLRSPFTHIA